MIVMNLTRSGRQWRLLIWWIIFVQLSCLHKIVTPINTLKNNSLTKWLTYLDSEVACCKVVFDLHYFAYWRQKQLPPSLLRPNNQKFCRKWFPHVSSCVDPRLLCDMQSILNLSPFSLLNIHVIKSLMNKTCYLSELLTLVFFNQRSPSDYCSMTFWCFHKLTCKIPIPTDVSGPFLYILGSRQRKMVHSIF